MISLDNLVETTSESDERANPNEFGFLNDLNLDQDVKSRLSIHLHSLLRGNSDVYTTPLCKRMSPEAILKAWDKIFESKRSKVNSVLYDLEMSNRDKFGPRSIAAPWSDRISSLKDYFEVSRDNKTLPIRYDYNKSSLRPLSNKKAMDLLKNNTNSGLPFYTRKSKVKDKTLREFDYLKYRKDPCILFTRTQEAGKTRNVWGYPMIDTLIEATFYFPLLDYQRKRSWRAAVVSPDSVDEGITKLIDKATKTGQSILSIDFSKYDASVSPMLINEAFRYIKCLFQDTFHDTLDLLCERFCTIGILTPDGVFKGEHGVPSRSTFTNEVDSIVQYLCAKSSRVVSEDSMQIQGDDGVYLVAASDVEKLLKSFEELGLKVNRTKSYEAKDYCIYLQNLYHPDYRLSSGKIGGIYPIYRALNRLIYQECWSKFEDVGLDGKDYYSLRAISILENCKHHPLFEDFVKFIFSLDKYSLQYTQKGLDKYRDFVNQGSGTGGVIENQYGDKVKGLKSFQTVKIVNNLL